MLTYSDIAHFLIGIFSPLWLLSHSNPGSTSLYNYYMRKHNPPVIHDSVTHVPERAARIRNFNDFAADVNASVLPQWIFVTPNMVDDGHDTTIDYASSWLEWWLVPLLKDKRFNSGEGRDGTLIILTFDENSVCFVHSQFKYDLSLARNIM
jgi:hypothetical protein